MTASSLPHVTWVKGGSARVVSIDAGAIMLRSTRPAPPGDRIEGTVLGGPPASLRVKVHACRRQPEGDYLVEGRPLDLPRDLRERLQAAAAAGSVATPATLTEGLPAASLHTADGPERADDPQEHEKRGARPLR